MSTSEASRGTLADVIAAVQASGLAPQRRQNMASAVHTVARILGRESAWPALHDALPNRADRVRLSGLMRWLSEQQIGPDAVALEDLIAFKAALFEEVLLKDPQNTWTNFAVELNRAGLRTTASP
jgi:hypothetical protein